VLYKPTCFTSSSIGPCPTLCDNFLQRDVTSSITWDDGWNFNDPSWFRTYHQCEPKAVMDVTDKLIANHRYYDLIMAFDERVLRECPNAVFLTESACSWLPRKWDAIDPLGRMNYGDGVIHKNPVVMSYEGCDVSAKQFAVSFLTSSKRMHEGHILRQEIYERLPEKFSDLAVWKHRSPPVVSDKRTVLEPYQFSIVPENSKQSGYYTEKILDCFIAKTVPLYWGCPNLGSFFNMNGVIQFRDYAELEAKLSSLKRDTYHSMREAVEDNFQRALKVIHQWDQIENHVTAGIEKKKTWGNLRIERPLEHARFFRRPLRLR
jgi:Glycosyltransferase family 10 (fucosyltransferase) C-term